MTKNITRKFANKFQFTKKIYIKPRKNGSATMPPSIRDGIRERVMDPCANSPEEQAREKKKRYSRGYLRKGTYIILPKTAVTK